MYKSIKSIHGLAQIPLMIMLLLMAIAVPVATKLVQDNADNRNLAVGAGSCVCKKANGTNAGSGTCAGSTCICDSGLSVKTNRCGENDNGGGGGDVSANPTLSPSSSDRVCVAGNLGIKCQGTKGTCQLYRNEDCSTACSANCSLMVQATPTKGPSIVAKVTDVKAQSESEKYKECTSKNSEDYCNFIFAYNKTQVLPVSTPIPGLIGSQVKNVNDCKSGWGEYSSTTSMYTCSTPKIVPNTVKTKCILLCDSANNYKDNAFCQDSCSSTTYLRTLVFNGKSTYTADQCLADLGDKEFCKAFLYVEPTVIPTQKVVALTTKTQVAPSGLSNYTECIQTYASSLKRELNTDELNACRQKYPLNNNAPSGLSNYTECIQTYASSLKRELNTDELNACRQKYPTNVLVTKTPTKVVAYNPPAGSNVVPTTKSNNGGNNTNNTNNNNNNNNSSCVEQCPNPKDGGIYLYTCNPAETDSTPDVKGCGWGNSMCGGSCYTCSSGSGWVKQSDNSKCPVPTTIAGEAPVLNYKIAFGGVLPSAAQCVIDWPLQFIVLSGGESKAYSGVLHDTESVANGKLVLGGSLKLTGFTKTSNIAAFIKNPKSLQTKYFKNNQTSMSTQPGGELTLTSSKSTSPIYDFTGFPMMPGDVVGTDSETQDGWINGVDFAYVKAKSLVHETVAVGGYLKGDLDGNCQVNSNDINLLKISLQEKQGQLY